MIHVFKSRTEAHGKLKKKRVSLLMMQQIHKDVPFVIKKVFFLGEDLLFTFHEHTDKKTE